MSKQLKVRKQGHVDQDLFFLYNQAISQQRFRIYKNKLKQIVQGAEPGQEIANAPFSSTVGMPESRSNNRRDSKHQISITQKDWFKQSRVDEEGGGRFRQTNKLFRSNKQPDSTPNNQQHHANQQKKDIIGIYLSKKTPVPSQQFNLRNLDILLMNDAPTPSHFIATPKRSNNKSIKPKLDMIIPFMEMKSAQRRKQSGFAARQSNLNRSPPGSASSGMRSKLYSAVVPRRTMLNNISSQSHTKELMLDQMTGKQVDRSAQLVMSNPRTKERLDSQPHKAEEDFANLELNCYKSEVNQVKIRKKASVGVTSSKKEEHSTRRNKKDSASPNRSKQFNIQIILRRKLTQGNIDSYMKHFKQRMEYPTDTKLFIFKSHDQYIKRLLLKEGWVENTVRESPAFHFKWVNGDVGDEYSQLQKGQYYNHFKNNLEMTTKIGLHRNYYRNAKDPGMQSYYPRSYDLTTEALELAEDYDRTAILALLKKHIIYFQSRNVQAEETVNDIAAHLQKTLEQQRFINSSHREDLQINIPVMVQTILFLENLRRGMNNLPQLYFLQKKTVDSIVQFSKINPPFQVFSNNRKSDILLPNKISGRGQNRENGSIQSSQNLSASPPSANNCRIIFKSDFNRYSANECFFTPSKDIISLLFAYHSFFKKNTLTYDIDGTSNLWMLKGLASSKGVGISIEDRLFNIVDPKKQAKLVQKYIQKPLLLTTIPQTSEYSFLNNHKFDIRQWVLVKSIRPLCVYTYSEFYIRVCPQEYDLQDFKNLARHLTNYSQNKHLFRNQSRSVLHSSHFCSLLQQHLGVSFEETVAPKIRSTILNTLKCYEDVLEENHSCFQLYGYDFLLGQDTSPYLLEINLSPACTQRTDWISEMLDQMGDGLLRIVLPESLYRGIDTPNKWTLLYKQ